MAYRLQLILRLLRQVLRGDRIYAWARLRQLRWPIERWPAADWMGAAAACVDSVSPGLRHQDLFWLGGTLMVKRPPPWDRKLQYRLPVARFCTLSAQNLCDFCRVDPIYWGGQAAEVQDNAAQPTMQGN